MSFQDYRSRKIKVFRNGDVYSPGKKLVVSSKVYRNFEQFLYQLATDVELNSGAVRKVYSIEGSLVRSLDDLKDGGLYVASGGEAYKRVPYLLDEDVPINDGKPKPKHSYGMLNSDVHNVFNSRERPIFGPSTKGYRVLVFCNGEPAEPTKVLLNYRNCRSFEQLMRFISSLPRLPSGQIKRIYDAITFKRVTKLQDLSDGQNIVAVSHETFKKISYQVSDINLKLSPTSADTIPKIVHFFPNGDPYHTGIRVTITRKRFGTLQKLLDHLNNHIELVTGKIQKVYGLDRSGTRITDIEQLDNAKGYVLVANDDPFISIRYNTKAISVSHSGPHGLAGYTTNNEHMSRIRKVTERWPKDRSFNNSVNQQQFEAAAASRKSSTRKKSAPKQQPKTPEPPKKATSEGVGTDAIEEKRFDSDTEEVYGETLVKHLSSENTRTPRTPIVSKSKPLTPAAFKKESSQELLAKSGIVSPKSALRSEVASPKSNLRSEVASPKSNVRSEVTSPNSNIRSQIASPKSNVRAATAKSEKSEIQENIDSEPEITASSRAESPGIVDSPKSKRSSKGDLVTSKSELKVGAREVKTPAPAKSNKGSEPSLVKSKSSLAKGSTRELSKPKTPADA